MGTVAFIRVRQVVVALAILLLTALAVQTPVEQAHLHAERFLALGASAPHASASIRPTVAEETPADLINVAIQPASEPHTSDAPASSPHHHHADGPPLHGLTSAAAGPTVSALSAALFQLENDYRAGLTGNPQDRPPRAHLEPIA